MVGVSIALLGAYNLQSIEDIGDKSISLGNEVLGHIDVATDTSWTNQGADEESAIELILAGNSMVDVQLLALGEARGEVVIRETAEFELEGQGWLDVTDSLFLCPDTTDLTESKVQRVLTGATDENGETTDTVSRQDILVTVDKVNYLLIPRILAHVVRRIEDAKSVVENVRRLTIVSISLAKLDRVEAWEEFNDFIEP